MLNLCYIVGLCWSDAWVTELVERLRCSPMAKACMHGSDSNKPPIPSPMNANIASKDSFMVNNVYIEYIFCVCACGNTNGLFPTWADRWLCSIAILGWTRGMRPSQQGHFNMCSQCNQIHNKLGPFIPNRWSRICKDRQHMFEKVKLSCCKQDIYISTCGGKIEQFCCT